MSVVLVVIDTNILVSSLWGGHPGKIIGLWQTGKLVVAVSREILDEYLDVLQRFDLSEADREQLLLLFSTPGKSVRIKPGHKTDLIKDDPDDNKFIDCALAARARFLISGDGHLLAVGRYPGGQILTARDFLKLWPDFPSSGRDTP